jgi:hypothetical protein
MKPKTIVCNAMTAVARRRIAHPKTVDRMTDLA